ncbi:MAG: RNA polymerase sigma factor [Planctomycetota bacterium]|nr:MAG: RNA polymerase sigma factor [Planctomycetota bacterium]
MADLDQLMSQARDADDRGAYAQVLEQCQHLLRAVALRDTANAELADEVAQEALVRGWERRAQYRSGTSPKAWLLAMVRSIVIDRHRRLDRDRRHLPDLIRGELLRHRDVQDDDQLREDRLHALEACLATVAPEHRELLDLVHRDGLSSEDAADTLGISAAACRQRLSRVQRALRSCIEQRLAEGPR